MLPLYPASLAITRVAGGNVRTVPIICIIGTVGTPRGRGGSLPFIAVQTDGAQSFRWYAIVRCAGAVIFCRGCVGSWWLCCVSVAVRLSTYIHDVCRSLPTCGGVIFCASVGIVAGWRAYSPTAYMYRRWRSAGCKKKISFL